MTELDDLRGKIDSLTKEKEELNSKLEAHAELLDDTLKYSDTVIVDCNEDFRILAYMGPFEYIFHEQKQQFKIGGNIMKIVYAVTKNLKDQEEIKAHHDTAEARDIEYKITEFMQSPKKEIELKIVGENNQGHQFLLKWNIKKQSRYFRSFFSILEAKVLTEKVVEHYLNTIKILHHRIEELLELSSDGFIILDIPGKIKFMNKNARKTLMSKSIKRLIDADIRGRFYREIFVNDTTEDINKSLDVNAKVLKTKEAQTFIKRSPDGDIHFSVFPDLNEHGDIQGLIIVTSLKPSMITNELEQKVKKLSTAIQKMHSEKNFSDERIKELEHNQTWMMKKMEESNQSIKVLHKSLKQLYDYLENLPTPICIIDLPTLRYEFVNSKMITWMNSSKKDIIGNRDEELLPRDLAILLNEVFKDTIQSGNSIKIAYNGYTIMQTAFSNEREVPTKLIRIIFK